ncbi:MAG TPA: hypothetical protein VGM54_10130 [Chthoniobacter sp.]|jgi:hypothetical protein
MIAISDDELAELVAARVAAVLTPELIAAIAAAHIDARIKRVTLEEAMPRLGCSNVRQLKDKCRALSIAIRKDLGQKAPYILLADIEARNTARSVVVPLVKSTNGTRIGKVESEVA